MSTWLKQTWPDLKISLLEGGILQITLDRAEASNAFSDEMIESLVTMMPLAEKDPSVRVFLITGAGKHFCAGGDIKAMNDRSGMFAGASNELRERYGVSFKAHCDFC